MQRVNRKVNFAPSMLFNNKKVIYFLWKSKLKFQMQIFETKRKKIFSGQNIIYY